jgi:hypothetical protein
LLIKSNQMAQQGYQQGGLSQGGPNQFYSSGIAGSQLNGTGSQMQTNKLNRKGAGGPNVVVVPGPIQYVEQPVEVIKTVKRPAVSKIASAAPVVEYRQLDPALRNLIAETQAKVALLVMENNRIKWRVAQRDAEIARYRSTGGNIRPSQTITNAPASQYVSQGAQVRTQPSTGVVRTSNAQTINTTRPSGTTYTTGVPTTYGGAPTTTQGGVIRTAEPTLQTTTTGQQSRPAYQGATGTTSYAQPGTQTAQFGGQPGAQRQF